MSDWGKCVSVVFEMLNTKSWILLVVTGTLLYLPESLLPKQALEIRENYGGWAVILLLLSICFTLNGSWKWVKKWLNRRNYKRKALEEFKALHPVQQLLLLDMFFQRRFTCSLEMNAPEVVTLVRYGYLSRYGAITPNVYAQPCVNTTLTPKTINLIQENIELMGEFREKLAQSGWRGEITG